MSESIIGNCPICESKLSHNESYVKTGAYEDYECPRCGEFRLSYNLLSEIKNNLEVKVNGRSIVSHWIRIHQSNKPIEISASTMNEIINSFSLPSVKEQADNMIIWLCETFQHPGKKIYEKIDFLISLIGALDLDNVKFIVRSLYRDRMFINYDDRALEIDDTISVMLSTDAWVKYDELLRATEDSRSAFMAMKFGDMQLERIYKEQIKQAVSEAGFEIKKLDEEPRAGLIDDRLRVEIRKSKFLIADLTHDNNGAYWEAGYAEGLGKQVIYTCRKGVKTHFDTNHHLTVFWEDTEEGLKEFREYLKATIRATLPTDAILNDKTEK